VADQATCEALETAATDATCTAIAPDEAADCAGAVADQATCEALETSATDDDNAKACAWADDAKACAWADGAKACAWVGAGVASADCSTGVTDEATCNAAANCAWTAIDCSATFTTTVDSCLMTAGCSFAPEVEAGAALMLPGAKAKMLVDSNCLEGATCRVDPQAAGAPPAPRHPARRPRRAARAAPRLSGGGAQATART
jgi:hypothetical protein